MGAVSAAGRRPLRQHRWLAIFGERSDLDQACIGLYLLSAW